MQDIRIDQENVILYGIDSSVTLSATLIPTGSEGVIEWSVANPAICTVSQEGVLRGFQFGQTTVNAYLALEPTILDMRQVFVSDYPRTLGIQPSTFHFTVYGDSQTAEAVLNAGATETFTVDDMCVITALQTGSGSLIARASDTDLVASATVSVAIPITEITLDQELIRINSLDSSFQVEASLNAGAVETILYGSSDEGIFTVSSEGVIQPQAHGEATLNMTVANSLVRKDVRVQVSIPITELNLNKTLLNFTDYEATDNLEVSFNEGAIGEVRYTVADNEICSVDEDGVVTALRHGVTTITIEVVGTDISREVGVFVEIPVSDITVNPDTLRFTSYEAIDTITAELNAGSVGTITYVSNDETVCTVNSSGVVTALQTGSANIVVSVSGSSVSREVPVSVEIDVTTIHTDDDEIYLDDLGEDYTVNARLNDGAIGTITYGSSDTTIFTVSDTGVIMPLAHGTATLNIQVTGETISKAIPITISIPITDLTLN